MQQKLWRKLENKDMPDENKLRVVIDTNLFISASLVTKNPPDQLIRSWLRKTFILLISFEQLEEIQDVSQRKKLKARPLFNSRITELVENIKFVAENIELPTDRDLPVLGRDPKDNHLLVCALTGNADYLVTGDEDLLILNGNTALGKLKIISAKDFLKIL